MNNRELGSNPLPIFMKWERIMSKDELNAKIDRLMNAFDGLNTALYEQEEVGEINALIGFLERELRVMRRSAELLTA